MSRLLPAALLFACACSSAPAEPAPSQSGRRHHVVVNHDSVLLDFVEANAHESYEVLTLNMIQNVYKKQPPINMAPLAR